jgi:hypothetical protein
MTEQVPQGGFTKEMCPSTMGGHCSYVENKCKRCGREKPQHTQQIEQVPEGGFTKKMCPRTMGGTCNFVKNPDTGAMACKLCKRVQNE